MLNKNRDSLLVPKLTTAEIKSMYFWFMMMRTVGALVMGAGLLFFKFFNLLNFNAKPILLFILPFLLLSNFVWWLVLKREFSLLAILHVQVIIDLLAISMGIYFSGGIRSEFIYLYLIVFLSSGMISLRMTIYVTIGALMLYFATSFPDALNYLSSHGSLFGYLDAHYIRHVAVFLIIALIIAFQGYYYISRLRKKEDEMSKIKDEFLFRTVHDLRSPAGNIRWLIEKYKQPAFTQQNQEFKEDLELIEDLDSRIINLVQDLSSVAKGEQFGIVLKKEEVDIKKIIETIIKEMAREIEKKMIHIQYEFAPNLPMINGDSTVINEVLTNILDNAIKYNKEGGSININQQIENKFIRTSISDTGTGISSESLKKLFTPYFRGDFEKKTSGTGLGLYLVKRLLEKMNGKIEVISRENIGSTFIIYLPL